jgi:hypothetical protein
MEFKRICKDFDLKLLQLATWGMLSEKEIEEKKSQRNSLQNDYENNIITLHQFDSSIRTLTEGLEVPSKEEIFERCKALR